eukprot:TRINITY_DN14843_c0_g1_i1.p1 TRINITY_DN14843_c0_g1~~TRINITY_DN14843_c0_g1_i1.p1  ORF type:complete len:254 (-),score=29.17 TRINITY_DN14843_c0_g1_i1:93-854(-)
MKVLARQGINICTDAVLSKISKLPSKLLKLFVLHKKFTGFTAEKIVLAGGREPCISDLCLDNADIKLKENGHILVDEYDATSISNIFVLGDAADRPMSYSATKLAAQLLADRLFGKGRNDKDAYRFKYEFVPHAAHFGTTMARCGYTERQAKRKFGEVAKYVYKGIEFEEVLMRRPLPYILKVICRKDADGKEIVVGMHGIGKKVDEVISGYGIAMSKGLLKEELQSFTPISGTTAEDLCNAVHTQCTSHCLA